MEEKIQLDDTYMNVIHFGNGKKVFTIIAGVTLTGLEGLGDALEQQMNIFLEEYSVFVFERKKVLPIGYSVEQMAEDIYRCLKLKNITSTYVMGASQGGMIGLALAINHPEFVNKLAICSSASRIPIENSNALVEWKNAAIQKDVVKLNTLFINYVYSSVYVDSIKDMIPELVKKGTDQDCNRFLILIEAIGKFNVSEKLAKIQCPLFVVADKNDKVIPYTCSQEIAVKTNCQIYLYDQYSHGVYDEAPDFRQKVKDFFEQ